MNARSRAELVDAEHGVRLYQSPEGFTVERPWRGVRHVLALAAGSVLAWVAVAAWQTGGTGGPAYQGPTAWWGFAVVATIAVYYGVTGLNGTAILIGRDALEIRRGPVPAFGARARRLPALASVETRFDRTVTIRGGVGDTYVVEGTLVTGAPVVLDLIGKRARAEAMTRLIRQAIHDTR